MMMKKRQRVGEKEHAILPKEQSHSSDENIILQWEALTGITFSDSFKITAGRTVGSTAGT